MGADFFLCRISSGDKELPSFDNNSSLTGAVTGRPASSLGFRLTSRAFAERGAGAVIGRIPLAKQKNNKMNKK